MDYTNWYKVFGQCRGERFKFGLKADNCDKASKLAIEHLAKTYRLFLYEFTSSQQHDDAVLRGIESSGDVVLTAVVNSCTELKDVERINDGS